MAENKLVDLNGLARYNEHIKSKISSIETIGKLYPDSTHGEIFNEYSANVASGDFSHAEGARTNALGQYSHAEGTGTTAQAIAAHAEGADSHATGQAAHAEGLEVTASGDNSHAEGFATQAAGPGAHAEGGETTASGLYSHSEGEGTNAIGDYSHAEGLYTTANTSCEHAEGQWNLSNTGNTDASRTIHSVGIGTGSTTYRRNAHEIMLNGDHYIYGIGNYDGTNYSDAKTLQQVINTIQGTLQTQVGTTNFSSSNYLSKETNLTDAVLQLDEEVKATNDNLALEHANAEAAYAKKTDLSGYLPLSGGTLTNYSRLYIQGHTNPDDNGEYYVGISSGGFFITKTSNQGTRIIDLGRDPSSSGGLGFLDFYNSIGNINLRIKPTGINITGKTANDLLNAGGGTTSISSIIENLATKNEVDQAISEAEFNNGHNAVSSVASIPVSKRLAIATISNNDSFTLASTPADGREIHVIVHNTSSSDIEITMPSSSGYVKMSGDTLTVAGNSYADINVISDGTNMYIRAL